MPRIPAEEESVWDLVHRLIRNVHEDSKYANVSKRLEPDRVNRSSVSVH